MIFFNNCKLDITGIGLWDLGYSLVLILRKYEIAKFSGCKLKIRNIFVFLLYNKRSYDYKHLIIRFNGDLVLSVAKHSNLIKYQPYFLTSN